MIDRLAKSIVERALESSSNDEVNAVDLRIQFDDDLSGLGLDQFGGGGNILDDLVLELVSPVQTFEFDAEPLLVEIHEHTQWKRALQRIDRARPSGRTVKSMQTQTPLPTPGREPAG